MRIAKKILLNLQMLCLLKMCAIGWLCLAALLIWAMIVIVLFTPVIVFILLTTVLPLATLYLLMRPHVVS
jgi:hypothetical protein